MSFANTCGILLLDKPQGLSSNSAMQRVRHAFGRIKAGHTGSLDPLATGVLPICLGEATKVAGLSLTFPMKVGEEDKLYGSVTASDIQRRLEEQGIHVDKRTIELAEPIRSLGEFRVSIKFHAEVRPEITVVVVKE